MQRAAESKKTRKISNRTAERVDKNPKHPFFCASDPARTDPDRPWFSTAYVELRVQFEQVIFYGLLNLSLLYCPAPSDLSIAWRTLLRNRKTLPDPHAHRSACICLKLRFCLCRNLVDRGRHKFSVRSCVLDADEVGQLWGKAKTSLPNFTTALYQGDAD